MCPTTDVVIRAARFPEDVGTVRTLFAEYAAGLAIDLSFQGFASEIDALPGAYAAPSGAVLVAVAGDTPLGCVAIRPLDGPACEMKRLYVRADARGRRIGAMLVTEVCALARERGYTMVRLDTLASMTPALELYARAGFKFIPAYTFNPIPGARYLELDLLPDAPARPD